MKKLIGIFIVAFIIPMAINTVCIFLLPDKHQEITNVMFSVYSVFFAILIASTYNFDTTNYSENFEERLDRELAYVRKKAILLYMITVLLFIFIDILEFYHYVLSGDNAIYYIIKLFSSVGFSCVYSGLLLVSEMRLYNLRNDIKHELRKERYNRDL